MSFVTRNVRTGYLIVQCNLAPILLFLFSTRGVTFWSKAYPYNTWIQRKNNDKYDNNLVEYRPQVSSILHTLSQPHLGEKCKTSFPADFAVKTQDVSFSQTGKEAPEYKKINSKNKWIPGWGEQASACVGLHSSYLRKPVLSYSPTYSSQGNILTYSKLV